ncbi:TatD family hydrolase [Candidatus Latescibacterota bacterium]
MLIDTHAHLDFENFDTDRDEVVSRAAEAGVYYIINPGCDLATSQKAVELSKTYEAVYAAVGIHPNSTSETKPGDFVEIALLAEKAEKAEKAGSAEKTKVIAIGEIGLDFYRDRAPKDIQVRAFRGQLDLARELGLPVIIHFRNVEFEGIDLVGAEYFKGLRGVFHCFGGSPGFAKKVMAMGFYIGFDGPLTYKKSDRTDVALEVPLEKCLLETDAPFLTPQKYRGQRNEPAYVVEVAIKMAELKNCGIDEVIEITGQNARTLFGI